MNMILARKMNAMLTPLVFFKTLFLFMAVVLNEGASASENNRHELIGMMIDRVPGGPNQQIYPDGWRWVSYGASGVGSNGETLFSEDLERNKNGQVEHVLVLEMVVRKDERGPIAWKVLDVAQYELHDHERFETCQAHEPQQGFMAIVKIVKRRIRIVRGGCYQIPDRVAQAWRVDAKTLRIAPISPKGLSCLIPTLCEGE